ncbi:hypothetical protein L1887_12802 [Cichorium endivia]|nr:hypothetical protein L1887_12802 [Cichorium endivia]
MKLRFGPFSYFKEILDILIWAGPFIFGVMGPTFVIPSLQVTTAFESSIKSNISSHLIRSYPSRVYVIKRFITALFTKETTILFSHMQLIESWPYPHSLAY